MKSTKEWISISDMMTGLMMVFLFISIIYINQVKEENKKHNELIKKIKEITKDYRNYKILIDKNLRKEFQKNLKQWKAEIVEDSLIFRFLSPDIMFSPGSSVIKPEFKEILKNFCPRYFEILYTLKEKIEEIRIEGHTSADWEGTTGITAYFKNMKLSQERARNVLNYCVTITNIEVEPHKWPLNKLTANGLSSSRRICKKYDTVRCRHRNRRVEFRIQVKEIQKNITDLVANLKLNDQEQNKKPTP